MYIPGNEICAYCTYEYIPRENLHLLHDSNYVRANGYNSIFPYTQGFYVILSTVRSQVPARNNQNNEAEIPGENMSIISDFYVPRYTMYLLHLNTT